MKLTADELLTTLILERDTGDRRLALVVEGSEDCALIDIHLRAAVAKTTWSGSKTAVLGAARQAELEGLEWIRFLVDSDLDNHLGVRAGGRNVVSTDNYDLLMDALESAPHLVRGAAISHGDREWIASTFAKTEDGDPLFERVLQVATVVGVARLKVREHALKLTTKGLNFKAAGHDGGFTSAVDWIRAQLEPRSAECWTHIEAPVSATAKADFSVCRGHDVTGALAALMVRPGKSGAGRDAVAGSLRLAVGCKTFSALTVVVSLTMWSVATAGESMFTCTGTAA